MTPSLLLLACADSKILPTPRDTAETPLALSIDSLAPGSGPSAGGTPVVVRGTGFTAESAASVGGSACVSLAFVSGQELTCVTPPGTVGAVELVVLEGAGVASMTFSYTSDGATDTGGGTADSGTADSGTADTATDTAAADSADTGATALLVDYCHLQWPCTMSKAPGATSDAVYAWVYQGDRTPGAGAGGGVRVEVGVGPNGSHPLRDVGWTWSPATYNADKDGLTSGDRANDEYVGTFLAPSRGPWDYCMRVSLDDGLSWSACDRGGDSCAGSGSDDGYRPDDAGQLTVR